MSEKVRYDNIDVARGLAMLVIIQWHVVGMHTTWTDGWVMPIFFILSLWAYSTSRSLLSR